MAKSYFARQTAISWPIAWNNFTRNTGGRLEGWQAAGSGATSFFSNNLVYFLTLSHSLLVTLA